MDYLKGVDASYLCEEVTLAKGTTLYQFRAPGTPTGLFFAESPLAEPKYLGISDVRQNNEEDGPVKRKLIKFTVTDDVTIMKSTASGATDTWSVRGEEKQTVGGDIQYFIPIELQKHLREASDH